MSMPPREIVITGVGVVSPLGIGREAFWSALMSGTSGVGEITAFDGSSLPVRLAAEVRNFDPQAYVKPRKSLKVMARDTQLGMTAAGLGVKILAWHHRRSIPTVSAWYLPPTQSIPRSASPRIRIGLAFMKADSTWTSGEPAGSPPAIRWAC